jgi:hypothetical protein
MLVDGIIEPSELKQQVKISFVPAASLLGSVNPFAQDKTITHRSALDTCIKAVISLLVKHLIQRFCQ